MKESEALQRTLGNSASALLSESQSIDSWRVPFSLILKRVESPHLFIPRIFQGFLSVLTFKVTPISCTASCTDSTSPKPGGSSTCAQRSLPQAVQVLLEVWNKHPRHLVAKEGEGYLLELLPQTRGTVQ